MTIETRFFPPSAEKTQLAAAVEAARQHCAENKLPIAFNWKALEGERLPEGYGLAILPQSKDAADGRVLTGCYIAGIPGLELVGQFSTPDDQTAGQDWIAETLYGALARKFKSSVRPRADGQPPAHVPFSVADFIISAATRSGSDLL